MFSQVSLAREKNLKRRIYVYNEYAPSLTFRFENSIRQNLVLPLFTNRVDMTENRRTFGMKYMLNVLFLIENRDFPIVLRTIQN